MNGVSQLMHSIQKDLDVRRNFEEGVYNEGQQVFDPTRVSDTIGFLKLLYELSNAVLEPDAE